MKGRKEGMGKCSYGNKEGLPFVCPMGHRHVCAACAPFVAMQTVMRLQVGIQRCEYVGQWFEDMFHGEGTFTCCDGRQYKGQVID